MSFIPLSDVRHALTVANRPTYECIHVLNYRPTCHGYRCCSVVRWLKGSFFFTWWTIYSNQNVSALKRMEIVSQWLYRCGWLDSKYKVEPGSGGVSCCTYSILLYRRWWWVRRIRRYVFLIQSDRVIKRTQLVHSTCRFNSRKFCVAVLFFNCCLQNWMAFWFEGKTKDNQ